MTQPPRCLKRNHTVCPTTATASTSAHHEAATAPRTQKTLRSWLASFNPPFDDAQIDTMLQALQAAGVLTVEGLKLVYPA